jgi:hypothetical protein
LENLKIGGFRKNPFIKPLLQAISDVGGASMRLGGVAGILPRISG